MTSLKNPLVSVILPVYNTRDEWLKQSIESILNQTFSDFEFIIINDGSTGNEDEIISSYSDVRIRYVKQDNQGLAKTLNRGLDLARGEYIARMDQDDISLPNRFEKQVNFLKKHPEISVVGTLYERFPEKGIVQLKEFPKYLDFLENNSIAHPTVMFKRQDFEKYGLRYNPDFKCEDYELWSRAIRFLNFANIQEVLLNYRWHGGNMSSPSKSMNLSVKKVKQNMLRFLTDSDCSQKQIVESFLIPKEKKLPIQKVIWKIKLFNVISILKVILKDDVVKIYLFDVVPIFKIKRKYKF